MRSQISGSPRERLVEGARRREGMLFAAMAALVLLKLWLVAWQQIAAQGSARFDDYLFVELAENLARGEWLGPYTERTLVKGPVYPLWLAAVSLAKLPLLPAQHVLHAVAAAAMLWALGPLLPHRGARLALFAVILFDPATYESTSHRVTREGIYTALTLLVAAAAAALAARPEARRAIVWLWSVFLGTALSLFWFTREEGPWILPAVVVPLSYAAVQLLRAGSGRRRFASLAPLAAPLIILAAAHSLLAQINRHYYAVATTVELRAPWFTRAYGALTRVDPEHQISRVPVAAAARAQLYKASASFAELEPYIEGHARLRAATDDGTQDATVTPEEMMGTWFIWAFRDAAAAAGHHHRLSDARDYYEQLADEVDAACADGRLSCGPPHDSLAPAWRPEYAERCWRFSRRLTHGLLSMRTVQVEQLPSLAADSQALSRYGELTHMPIEGTNSGSTDGAGFFRVAVLQSIAAGYRAGLYPAVILAAIAFLAGVVYDLRARRLSATMAIAAGLLGASLTRVALLTYISASAYPIFHGIYQRAIYPLLYVFIALCAAHAVAALRPKSAANEASLKS